MEDALIQRGVAIHLMDTRRGTVTEMDSDVWREAATTAAEVAAGLDRSFRRESRAAMVRGRRGTPMAIGSAPIGFKLVGPPRQRRAEQDADQRAVLQAIVRLKDEEDMSFDIISDTICPAIAEAPGVKWPRRWERHVNRGWWNKNRCWRGYHAERELAKQDEAARAAWEERKKRRGQ